MNDGPIQPDSSPTPAARGRRFKRRELGLPDGGRLVLNADGSIDHLDAEGSTMQAWARDDPEWPRQAIRFGLRPQVDTIAPTGRRVDGTRPPRG